MKKDFPVLDDGKTYLDSACMTLRPKQVIGEVEDYYRNLSSCPGRSSHSLAEKTTEKIEGSRKAIAEMIKTDKENIVFTSGTTESINTVAEGFNFNKVIISDKEHNSNILPWQKQEKKVISTLGRFDLERLDQQIGENDLVSVVHKSNLDGSELPIEKISNIVQENNAHLLVDAAQSIGHQKVSVKDIDPDFMAFSGHKMLGPSGTGILYVADRVKEDLEPLKRGGGAVKNTSFKDATPTEFPQRMEAGLPNAAGIIGLKPAADYLKNYGLENISRHEENLTNYFYEQLEDIDGVSNVGRKGTGVFSVCVEGVSSHQAALMLDRKNIMVRSGKHCVHPWFEKYGEQPTLRASLHLYNDKEDIRTLVEELEKIAKLKG